jgi:hypothetical protein
VIDVLPTAGRAIVPDPFTVNVTVAFRDDIRPAFNAINHETGCVVPSGIAANVPKAAV